MEPADQVLGLITRSQLIAATTAGQTRTAAIMTQLTDIGREHVLSEFLTAADVLKLWKSLDQVVRPRSKGKGGCAWPAIQKADVHHYPPCLNKRYLRIS